MTISAYVSLHDPLLAGLDAQIATYIGNGYQPYGNPYWNESKARHEQVVTTSSLTAGAIPTAVAPYVTATETGNGVINQTTLTVTALPLTLTDAAAGGGVKVFTFPAGRICRFGAEASLAMTTTSVLASTLNTGVTCNYGVGSVTQSNGTLATTEQDIVNTTNITASATINVAGAAAAGVGPGVLASLDGRSVAIAAFLNVGVATGTDIDGDATVTLSGTIKITWANIGA